MSKRRVMVGVAVLAMIAAALVLWLKRDGKGSAVGPESAGTGAGAGKRADRAVVASTVGPGGGELNVLIDDDREGDLRLEGIVVDADEQPVGGAVVTVSTNPPRSTQ